MSGISSKALNFGEPENKKKYNGIEFENDLELNIYDAQFRELDAQVGRWWQIDPVTDGYESISPYASMYNNPLTYSDPLGDEGETCCDGLFEGLNHVLTAASGFVNGMLNAGSLGLVSTDPFGYRAKISGDIARTYDVSVTFGQAFVFFMPGPKSSTVKTPELVPVGPKVQTPIKTGPAPEVPVSVKTQPLTPPGGGKNAQHKNQKAKEAAQQKYEAAKENYNTLKSKANKTKEDKAAEAKAKTEMNHQRKRWMKPVKIIHEKQKGVIRVWNYIHL